MLSYWRVHHYLAPPKKDAENCSKASTCRGIHYSWWLISHDMSIFGAYPIPSGKHTKKYGKSPFSSCMFPWTNGDFPYIYVNVYQRVYHYTWATISQVLLAGQNFRGYDGSYIPQTWLHTIWLVVWNINFIFPYGNVIIPTDDWRTPSFLRGVGIPPAMVASSF